MGLLSRTVSVAAIAFLAATCLYGGVAISEGQILFWPNRKIPKAVDPNDLLPVTISLDVPSPFGLTVNQGVSIGLTVEDGNEGLTFRPAEGSFMPGLSVDAATGTVSGTPASPAGTEFAIAVEAVRNDFVVGATQTVSRILRDPIDIDIVPESVRLATGEPLLMTIFGAVGGDQDTIEWSLQNAPDWLDVLASGPGQAILAVASGHEAAETPERTVSVVAADAEGRQDSKSFVLEVKTAAIAFDVPSPFGLTTGQPVSLALQGDPGFSDVTYIMGGDADMPGLTVDPETGAISGTPSATAGTPYRIAVDAVRNGATIASAALDRVLRDPISVDVYPEEVVLTAGEPFPDSGLEIQASGGDPESIEWSLEGAPVWLDIEPTGNGSAVLVQADGQDVTETSTTVTIVASDAEGREDRSRSFEVVVMPGLLANKLIASDGAAYDYFGFSVSLSADGQTALIGTEMDGNSAYVFDWNGSAWIERAKLVASDGAAGDYFGYSVSLSADGQTALIGAYTNDDNGSNSGSAYVFDWNGSAWIERAKLVASDGAANDYFGFSVSLSADGQTALIGAYGDDGKGSTYVFDWNGSAWIERAKFVASDGAAGDSFGSSVSLSADGQTALIGAYMNDRKGSAYVFSPQH